MNRVLVKDIEDVQVIRIGDNNLGLRVILKPNAKLMPKSHPQGLFVVGGDIHLLGDVTWEEAHDHAEILREEALLEDLFGNPIQAVRTAKQNERASLFTCFKDTGLYAVKSA